MMFGFYHMFKRVPWLLKANRRLIGIGYLEKDLAWRSAIMIGCAPFGFKRLTRHKIQRSLLENCR